MHPPAFSPAPVEGPSDGPRAGRLYRALFGRPPLEWQQDVLDAGLARHPDTGLLRHRTVGVTVARQNGKSDLLRALIANAALTPGAQIGFTSQDRQVAVDVLFSPTAEAFEDQGALFGAHVIRSNGHERCTLRRLGSSRFMPLSPTEKAGHGYSLDLAVIDEAWAQFDNRLAQAIGPTQVARPDPQLWIVSTAGVAASSFLRGIVDAGRDGDLCYFEWSAADDADDEDPATWAQANPAYGVTISAEALVEARQIQGPTEFARAHLNRWVAATSGDAIPPAAWSACFDPGVEVERAGMVLAFEVSQSRDSATICAASNNRGGRIPVEVVEMRPGTRWLIPRLVELRDRHRPAGIVANYAGQTRATVDDCPAAGLAVEAFKPGDYVGACQVTFDSIVEGRTAHRGQERLDAAVRLAGRRRLAGSWVWAPGAPDADIGALVAATLATARAARPQILPFTQLG